MKRSIVKLRTEYGNEPLLEKELKKNPIDQFKKWFYEALDAAVMEPNGMTLSTVSEAGRPTARTVLLKNFDDTGFTFYTHYQSRKGKHLELHPFASLTFWWKEIYRQVNIEGPVTKISRKETLSYFYKRPRGAQLAAVSSFQSEPLASRDELEVQYLATADHYKGKKVPCPAQWGGYRLVPERIEFWQGRANRLHDRFVYVKMDRGWIISRLYP